MKRTIKKIHPASYEPIGDLVTYRALPTRSVNHIDPFLFLNHHGPQVYKPSNRGLPFGPHPHRGFETVTFILDGDIAHHDSGGNSGVILPGGVQWMTAGGGLIHEEVSSEDFKRTGGKLEILQLWVNLPAKHKMVAPSYKDLQKADIPAITSDDGRVTINAVSGIWNGIQGGYKPLVDISLATIDIKAGGTFRYGVPEAQNIFFYVIRGNVSVNDTEVPAFRLVEFHNQGTEIVVLAEEAAIILFGHALPFNEPIVAQGPFVMNTQQEIMEAYMDYQHGKFGQLG